MQARPLRQQPGQGLAGPPGPAPRQALRGRPAAAAGAAGSCAFVSSGPGAADLLTLRAARLLAGAEVILYDSLGTGAVLDEHASPAAERCFVGKRGGRPSPQQADIDALLLAKCLEGKRVVRLKGGCVSTFSRVASELATLRVAGVPCQLVPGVSSVAAAPLVAGFPLTAAGLGEGFSVHSAHDLAALDWGALGRARHTLVFLMAGRGLGELQQRLLEGSELPGDLPVAVVRDATTPAQRVWLTSLGADYDSVFGAEALSPAVVIVGPVVSLAHEAEAPGEPGTWYPALAEEAAVLQW